MMKEIRTMMNAECGMMNEKRGQNDFITHPLEVVL